MPTTEAWAAVRQHLKQGQFEAAIEGLLAIVEADDEDADALCYLGACYGHLKQFVEAEFYLSQACDLVPERPQPHFNLGRCFEARHRLEDAIRCYENALRADRRYQPARDALQRLHATLSPDLRDVAEELKAAAEEAAGDLPPAPPGAH